MSVRCLIVDDNQGFLESAGKVLTNEGITIVGVASTSAEAVRRAEEVDPDVVLVDIVLGSESGFDLTRQLAAGRARIILISTHAEEDFADLIAGSPAIGFLPKWKLSARAINHLLAQPDEGVEESS